MQLQFLALVEYFLSSLRVAVFDLGGLIFLMIYSFAAVRFVMSTLFIKKGTFNHCGRSNASNSTHNGTYVFQRVYNAVQAQ